MHWDGESWGRVDSPNPEGVDNDGDPLRYHSLYDVDCVSAGDCWAVGHYAATTNHNTLVEHWDGQSWRLVPSATTDDKLHEVNIDRLYDVSCVGAGDCWTIGNRVRGDTLATLTLRTAGLAFTADSPTGSVGSR